MKKRVVVIGLGDAGLLTAMRLPKSYEVIAISSKPCFVSGQEVGNRVAQLDSWKELNKRNFDRFQKMDHVKIIHGLVKSLDLKEQTVTIQSIQEDEQHILESYDALLIATGTTNGFWRNSKLETSQQIEDNLSSQAQKFQSAQTIAVVGGGPTAVSAASNLKIAYPEKSVHLFSSRPMVLAGYADKARTHVQSLLKEQGVELHQNHRAKIDGVDVHEIGSGEIQWQTPEDAKSFSADAILWAVGAIQPNNECLPKELLNDDGFVKVTPQLYHPDFPNVFSVGDICASDPNRSSVRNDGYVIAAKNIDLYLKGKTLKLKSFSAPEYRWGSILGIQPEGMRIYERNGSVVLIKKWLFEKVVFPFIVQKLIYRGVRKASSNDP